MLNIQVKAIKNTAGKCMEMQYINANGGLCRGIALGKMFEITDAGR
jgi:hypothetical protein